MTLLSLLVPIAILGYLLYRKETQLEDVLKAHMIESSAHHAAWAQERQNLLNRIQVPEAAPYIHPGEPTKAYAGFDSDDEYHAAQDDSS